MDEHLTESQEKDVSESQGNTDTYIPSDTASSLLGRECHTHDGKYEGRERESETGILFNQSKFDICITSHLLDLDKFVKFPVVQSLHRIFRKIEILDSERYDGIYLFATTYTVGKVVIIFPDKVLLQSPRSCSGIIYSRLCRDLRYKPVIFDLLESETVSCAVPRAE